MSVESGRHPVAGPVDVDDLAGLRKGVDGAQVHCRVGGGGPGVRRILLPVPEDGVVPPQGGEEPHLVQRHGPAEAHGSAVDDFVQVLCGALLVREEPDRIAASLQIFLCFHEICHG